MSCKHACLVYHNVQHIFPAEYSTPQNVESTTNKRSLNLKSVFQDDIDSDFDVNNETANRMSLFYAHATPMLKVLSDTTTKFVSDVSIVYTIIVLCLCACG